MSDRDRQDGWYGMSTDEVLERLDTSRAGLAEGDVAERREQYGPNTIGGDEGVSPWRILLHQFTSPLIYLLLVAMVVTIALQHWMDTIVIGAVVVINAVIGFIQEYQAENSIRALIKMVSAKARVRRDGKESVIDSSELVPGDLVSLSGGDMVPADLRLLETSSLQINEAALTGESVPVEKSTDVPEEAGPDLPATDQQNMAFMGTAVTAGSAQGVVVSTGERTRMGEIAEHLRSVETAETPLQQRMGRLGRWIAVVIVVVAAIAFGIGIGIGRDVEEMFLMAVALAVSAIPEGLPIVMTVALAVSVRRMARRHAIIRQLPAIETLGSTTLILSDKTGTLTQNQMTVKAIWTAGNRYEVTGSGLDLEGAIRQDDTEVEVEEGTPLYQTLLTGLLNNEATLEPSASEDEDETDPEQDDQESNEPEGDPMELALLVSARKAGLDPDELNRRYRRSDEVPFSSERKFSATIHENDDGPLVFVKGAPERIVEMCSTRYNEDGQTVELDRSEILEVSESLASEGLRVLAMAFGRGSEAAQAVKSEEPEGLTLLGLQGFLDPPRPEAVEAIRKCHDAGIKVKMVTGDHATTAAAIAQRMHLVEPEKADREETGALPVCSGKELSDLSDEEVDERLGRVSVFARVTPDQKLRLVERLRSIGEIVAVTGDGVNDAPALKAAHLGVAMGQAGTEVAKEASTMVLTNDNFASIYAAVEEGRTAFRNIQMATFFLLSSAVGEVLAILASLLLRFPLPLLPAQILWVNLVTNGIQDVALAWEPGEQELFRRRPRPLKEGVMNRLLMERLIGSGLIIAAVVLAIFWWEYRSDQDLSYARTAALTSLVLLEFFHVFNCRSEHRSIFKKRLWSNRVLLIGATGSLAVHIGALYFPPTQALLRVEPLAIGTWGIILASSVSIIAVVELHKLLRRPSE